MQKVRRGDQFQTSFCFLKSLILGTGGFKGDQVGHGPMLRAFGSQTGHRTYERKRRIIDFKQKKEARKGIIASQLAIRNFNDITRKHMDTPCVFFIFTWFSLKAKRFQQHFCKKQTLFPVVQLVKTCLFPVHLINVKNVFNLLNVYSVRNHFYVK